MCTKTDKRLIILVLLSISLVFTGCSSSSSEIDSSPTPEDSEDSSPSPILTEKEPEAVETSLTQEQLILQDSAAPLSPGTIDKIFLISHKGQKGIPADKIVIEIYEHGELVDSLKYDTYTQRFQGNNMRSFPFSDGTLDYDDDVIITEMSGFNVESDSMLTIKVIHSEKNQNLLYGQLRVI